jgi:hypothetical protein
MMDGEIVNAMIEERNQCDLFEPQVLLETLYTYPSLKERGKELMESLLEEIL